MCEGQKEKDTQSGCEMQQRTKKTVYVPEFSRNHTIERGYRATPYALQQTVTSLLAYPVKYSARRESRDDESSFRTSRSSTKEEKKSLARILLGEGHSFPLSFSLLPRTLSLVFFRLLFFSLSLSPSCARRYANSRRGRRSD